MKNYLRASICATLLVSSMASVSSYADEQGYVGLQYGNMRSAATNGSSSDHVDLDHAGISLGFKLAPMIGIEAQYTDTLKDESVFSGDLSTRTLAAYAKVQTPGPVYATGRLGVAQVDYDWQGAFSKTSERTSDLAYGAGVGFKLGESASIEVNYTRLPDLENIGGFNTDIKNELVTAGVNLNF
jgi:opacity protein-like surface antigen